MPEVANPQPRGARVPVATPGCDLRQLPLTPAEAYVFSRIDGAMSEHDLGICIGLDAATVTSALERLAIFGAIRFADGAPRRATSQTMPRACPAPSVSPPPVAEHAPRRSDVAPTQPRRSDVAPTQPRHSDVAPNAPRRSDVAPRVTGLSEPIATLVHRGDTAARGRLWEQAAKAYEEAARLAPKNPSVLYKVAGARFRCDEYSTAARFAERAVALSPSWLDAWLLLAHIHDAAGAPIQAREALTRAQELAPEDGRVARLDEKIPR